MHPSIDHTNPVAIAEIARENDHQEHMGYLQIYGVIWLETWLETEVFATVFAFFPSKPQGSSKL